MKIKFSIARLKLNNMMVDKLMRNYLRRYQLHIKIFHKLERDFCLVASNMNKFEYFKKKVLLLTEDTENFRLRRVKVSKHIYDAVNTYWLRSGYHNHALENEVYRLIEKGEFRVLSSKLLLLLLLC